MSKPPIAGPHTEGRTLGADWSITNVVKLLRANAERGAWHSTDASRGGMAAVNQYYVRKASAKHLPTRVSLIFMRLAEEGCMKISDTLVGKCFGDEGIADLHAAGGGRLLVCVAMLRGSRRLSAVGCGSCRAVARGVVWRGPCAGSRGARGKLERPAFYPAGYRLTYLREVS